MENSDFSGLRVENSSVEADAGPSHNRRRRGRRRGVSRGEGWAKVEVGSGIGCGAVETKEEVGFAIGEITGGGCEGEDEVAESGRRGRKCPTLATGKKTERCGEMKG
ncbi:hypothetical protein LOK49_LG02G01504 [Camellia lanceoleosa]|uniref:Uncharacterized protein n=1 Tax=Camellia lanceoleosa TaxID=1840588 RepID=A0ACC0INZ4_9ERIC|nr:hypothetical protein LOK49_LG02G01504 [Camellia lanceoleosa]